MYLKILIAAAVVTGLFFAIVRPLGPPEAEKLALYKALKQKGYDDISIKGATASCAHGIKFRARTWRGEVIDGTACGEEEIEWYVLVATPIGEKP